MKFPQNANCLFAMFALAIAAATAHAQVTLLSQTRYVNAYAEYFDPMGGGCFQSPTLSMTPSTNFTPFIVTLDPVCPGSPWASTAAQNSTISTGVMSAEMICGGNSSGPPRSHFEVRFRVDSAIEYSLNYRASAPDTRALTCSLSGPGTSIGRTDIPFEGLSGTLGPGEYTYIVDVLGTGRVDVATLLLGPEPTIDWYTIDGGGAMGLSGGIFTLSGTLAQPDASRFDVPLSGGDFSLVSGFWTVAIPPPFCPCVADFDGSSGTPDSTDITAYFDAWLAGDPAADADCSGGTPDLTDITQFFQEWLAGGC